MTAIPVFETKFAKGWPVHAVGDAAAYTPIASALVTAFGSDAHFATYSVPEIGRRLADASVFDKLAAGAPIVLFVVDAEPAKHAPVTPEWWAAERAKLDQLLALHPGGYVYRTRGGYRVVYLLAAPVVLRSTEDAEAWKARYLAWLDYLDVAFSIVGDRSCQDWTRLYRLPRVIRDGQRYEPPETIGDPTAIGTWNVEVEIPAPEPRQPSSSNGTYTPKPGDFNIDDFISAHYPGVRERGSGDRRCWDIECPWKHEHSPGKGANRETTISFTGDGGPRFHCFHDHCSHREWKDLRRFHDPTYVPFDERPPPRKPYSGPEPYGDDAEPDVSDLPPDDVPHAAESPPPRKRGRKPKGDGAVKLASTYVSKHCTHADGPTLRRWRGDWYRWSADRGCYTAVSDEQIESDLYRRLNLGKRGDVGDVRHALIAVDDVLVDHVELGAWLGDGGIGNPLEVAACRNGLLHLPTRSLVPSSPRYFATSALGVDFAPTVALPKRWLTFLHELWGLDEESIGALQEWIGYLLTPDTRQQKIAMLIGPKRSGKGTIARIVAALLGNDSVAAPTLASLGTNFGLQPLIGKTAAIIGDARLSGRSDIAVVVERLLSLSGEDTLTIDRKFREAWTGRLRTRLTIISNELPRFTDASDALSGRMLLLELQRSWFGQEDHGLEQALLAEMPGILLWAIDGWQRLRDRGRFVQPAASATSIDELTDLASPVAAWARYRCKTDEPDPQWWVACDFAFEDYCSWAEKNGHHKPSQTTFGRDIKAATGCPRKEIRRDGGKVRVYQGLALR